ncbi:substrate-binding protein [Chryseolinea serpens]|uniref:Substrate-binding protein n=1 Tax=Chryseolinea serpens TaxID=947013 RepID=A0A1M5QK41_9BACT|nr:ABC transporter substrate-binding protein [Chryseolinea serpens]SHH14159.1 substrate-binding protein [Chryseolinea serpens]
MLRKGVLFFVLIACLQSAAFAQVDFTKQYFNAKTLFREGKWNLAMESFKPLMPYSTGNPFSEYASFFYALAAYNQNYKAVAKSTLVQIKTLHPTWDKMDEVNFWLGKINLEEKDYFQGLKMFAGLQDKKLQQDAEAIKAKNISTITDVETLRMMLEEYPKDPVVGTALATALSKNPATPEDKELLESVIKKFNLDRAGFIPEAPKSYFKDTYTISALLPFMVNTLDASPVKKRNQSVLDLYEGMKLAVDTLAKQGVKISFRAYDTERNLEKIKSILNTEELKSTDLIAGPFFMEESKLITDFSLANRINVFNPVHNNSELIGNNPYAFLYQPSLEILGRKSGEFMADNVKKKNCLVFYGTSKRDSVLAANFMQAAKEKNFKIMKAHRVSKEGSQMIFTTLATPTEYDEFHYPKQFTLKKDSVGSIYVASDDALIYAKVLSSIETRKDDITVLGSETWLDQTAVDLEKFQNLSVVLASPNFVDQNKPLAKTFVRKYIKTHGRAPSNYAVLGYAYMLFVGNELKKNGVYFQDALAKEGIIPGNLTEGYNYQQGRSNELVPFVRFEEGEMKVLERR